MHPPVDRDRISMTETKQDIQAQIDRLDLDWRGGLDDYKV